MLGLPVDPCDPKINIGSEQAVIDGVENLRKRRAAGIMPPYV